MFKIEKNTYDCNHTRAVKCFATCLYHTTKALSHFHLVPCNSSTGWSASEWNSPKDQPAIQGCPVHGDTLLLMPSWCLSKVTSDSLYGHCHNHIFNINSTKAQLHIQSRNLKDSCTTHCQGCPLHCNKNKKSSNQLTGLKDHVPNFVTAYKACPMH